MALAQDLCERLPRTLSALAAGRLDEAKAHQIATAARPLNDTQCTDLEARIFPQILGKTPSQVARLVRAAVIAVDPDGADDRATHAKRCRRVETHNAEDGMAWLTAYAPAEHLRAAYHRIDTLARELGKDDERTMDQRRADVLIELLLGTQQSSVTTHVYVTVRAETLLGPPRLRTPTPPHPRTTTETTGASTRRIPTRQSSAARRTTRRHPTPQTTPARRPTLLKSRRQSSRPAQLANSAAYPGVAASVLFEN